MELIMTGHIKTVKLWWKAVGFHEIFCMEGSNLKGEDVIGIWKSRSREDWRWAIEIDDGER